MEKSLKELIYIPYVRHTREHILKRKKKKKKNLPKQWSVSLISSVIYEVCFSFIWSVCDVHNIGMCQILPWTFKHLPFAGPLFAYGMLHAPAYKFGLVLSSKKWAYMLVAVDVCSTSTEDGVLQPEDFSHC